MACEEEPTGDVVECPEGLLEEGDLPCDCQGSVVESLSCGDVYCESFGLSFDTEATGCTDTGTTTD